MRIGKGTNAGQALVRQMLRTGNKIKGDLKMPRGEAVFYVGRVVKTGFDTKEFRLYNI